jgi:hypothetical protein
MNIDKVRFRSEFVVPYVFKEGCARQQLIAPLHHVFEQLELARPQIDRPVATLRARRSNSSDPARSAVSFGWACGRTKGSLLDIRSTIASNCFEGSLLRSDDPSIRPMIFSSAPE